MALVDQYGNPLKKNELLTEQATPTVTGVRQILSDHPTSGLTPGDLARILRDAEEGQAEDYLALAEDIEEKDLHYLSVLGTRKRAVAQLEITVEPASDDAVDVANAEIIEQWLKRDQIEEEIFDMLDGIGKGFSASEILWDTSESQWMPKDIKWRDPRWFELSRLDGTTLLLRDTAGSVPLKPYSFINHRHKAKSGLPIRGGLARAVSWMWMFKNFAVKDWVIFAEAYGQPIRVGKYGPGATKEDRDQLKRAVSSIASDAGAIIPDSMVIEFVEAMGKTSTSDVFERLIDKADAQISKAVLGQTMTADNGSSRSQAEVHNDVRGDIQRSDAKQLAATLNRDLIIPIIVLNRGPQKAYPKLCLGKTEDVDIDRLSQAAERFVNIGGRVSQKGLREKLGLPEPEDDGDAIVAPAAPSVPPIQQNAAARNHCPTCAAAETAPGPDVIDDAAANEAGEWERVFGPVLAEVERALDESEDYGDFQQRLLELLKDWNAGSVAEKLARVSFAARLAGNLEVDLGKK